MQATSFIPIAYRGSCPNRSNPWTAKCNAEVQFFLSYSALQKSTFLRRPQCAPALHTINMDANLITDGTRNVCVVR
jgi:hypothetical protein